MNGSSPAPRRPLSPPYPPRTVLSVALLLTLLAGAGGTALDRVPQERRGSRAVVGLAPLLLPRRTADTQASRDARAPRPVLGTRPTTPAPAGVVPSARRTPDPAAHRRAYPGPSPTVDPAIGVASVPSAPAGTDPVVSADAAVAASYADLGGMDTVRLASVRVVNRSTVDHGWQVELRYPAAVRSMRLLWSADPSATVIRRGRRFVLHGARVVGGGAALSLVRLDADATLTEVVPVLCVVDAGDCGYP